VSIVDFPAASPASSDQDDQLVEPLQRLKLRVQPCDGYTIISVWGELLAGTTDLRNGMLETITRGGSTRVLLDLSRLYDVDTDAIAELMRWQSELASSRGGLWLAAPRPWVRRLLEQAVLRGTFTVYPSMLEALAEITPSRPDPCAVEIDVPRRNGYPRRIPG
jgi:anti-anti-sigma regulatory factor